MSLVERVVGWLRKPAIEKSDWVLLALEERLFYQAIAKARKEMKMRPWQQGVFRFETNRFGGGREYLTFSEYLTSSRINKREKREMVLQIERPANFAYGVESYQVVFFSGEFPVYFRKLDGSTDLGIFYGEWQEVKDEQDQFFIVKEFLDILPRAYPQRTPMRKERMFSFDQEEE